MQLPISFPAQSEILNKKANQTVYKLKRQNIQIKLQTVFFRVSILNNIFLIVYLYKLDIIFVFVLYSDRASVAKKAHPHEKLKELKIYSSERFF